MSLLDSSMDVVSSIAQLLPPSDVSALWMTCHHLASVLKRIKGNLRVAKICDVTVKDVVFVRKILCSGKTHLDNRPYPFDHISKMPDVLKGMEIRNFTIHDTFLDPVKCYQLANYINSLRLEGKRVINNLCFLRCHCYYRKSTDVDVKFKIKNTGYVTSQSFLIAMLIHVSQCKRLVMIKSDTLGFLMENIMTHIDEWEWDSATNEILYREYIFQNSALLSHLSTDTIIFVGNYKNELCFFFFSHGPGIEGVPNNFEDWIASKSIETAPYTSYNYVSRTKVVLNPAKDNSPYIYYYEGEPISIEDDDTVVTGRDIVITSDISHDDRFETPFGLNEELKVKRHSLGKLIFNQTDEYMEPADKVKLLNYLTCKETWQMAASGMSEKKTIVCIVRPKS